MQKIVFIYLIIITFSLIPVAIAKANHHWIGLHDNPLQVHGASTLYQPSGHPTQLSHQIS